MTNVIIGDVQAEPDNVIPAGFRIPVDLAWEPAWATSRMSPRAKAFMGW